MKVFVIVKRRSSVLLIFRSFATRALAQQCADTIGLQKQDFVIHQLEHIPAAEGR